MILGKGTPHYGYCFEEIDKAVSELTDRIVVFNEKHHFKAPADSIIFNLENVPGQVNPELWADHEIWDCSERNISRYPKDVSVKYVPMGYHPSMKRFERKPQKKRDIDVVFCGWPNERRAVILNEMRRQGLRVEVPSYSVWGKERDELIARAKLALDMRYYEDGIFPALRSLHLVSNGVPVLAETSPEMPLWVKNHVTYDKLVSRAIELLRDEAQREAQAAESFSMLQSFPLTLPVSESE